MESLAFDEGMKAFQLCKFRTENPYLLNTVEYKEWLNGYEYAADTEPD